MYGISLPGLPSESVTDCQSGLNNRNVLPGSLCFLEVGDQVVDSVGFFRDLSSWLSSP